MGAAGRWGAAVQAQPCPESTDLRRDILGVPSPSRSSGSSTRCAPKVSHSLYAGPIFVRSTFPWSFPWEAYSRANAETSRPPSRPVVPPLLPVPSFWCPSSWMLEKSCWMLLGRRATASGGGPWWPTVARWSSNFVQVPGNAFPPSGLNQGCKERMGTTRICISSRCCHSAPSTRSGIILNLLPSIGCRCPERSDGACPTVRGSDACLRNYFSRFLS